jgi:hypothetical protein
LNGKHLQLPLLFTLSPSRILKNGSSYPGKHNFPTERTSPAMKPLEPKSQVFFSPSTLDVDCLESSC